jgi:DNA-binding FadR family transcriptional regulator
MSRQDHVTQLAERLERGILSGEYASGELLPSEREISSRLGLSRSVVREALGRLASLGLVRTVHGSGTRVEAPTARQVALGYRRLLHRPDYRLADLAAVRLPLETTIAELAAQRRTDAHLAQLEGTQAVLGNSRRSLEAHVKADLEFHVGLADATGNPIFALVLSPMQQLLIESRRQTLGRYGSEIAHQHHARILAAVAAGDAQAASRAMQDHLEANFRHLREPNGESITGQTS